ncbi:hypothetical protein FSOLCH5_000221 [Fusarium solani]|nr:hypothetical protein NW759_006659 [Fusarium solani]
MDPRPRSSPLSSRGGLAPSQFRHQISDHGMSVCVQPQTHSHVSCHTGSNGSLCSNMQISSKRRSHVDLLLGRTNVIIDLPALYRVSPRVLWSATLPPSPE